MVLGLASGKVSLALAHDAWAAAYERERARIVASPGAFGATTFRQSRSVSTSIVVESILARDELV